MKKKLTSKKYIKKSKVSKKYTQLQSGGSFTDKHNIKENIKILEKIMDTTMDTDNQPLDIYNNLFTSVYRKLAMIFHSDKNLNLNSKTKKDYNDFIIVINNFKEWVEDSDFPPNTTWYDAIDKARLLLPDKSSNSVRPNIPRFVVTKYREIPNITLYYALSQITIDDLTNVFKLIKYIGSTSNHTFLIYDLLRELPDKIKLENYKSQRESIIKSQSQFNDLLIAENHLKDYIRKTSNSRDTIDNLYMQITEKDYQLETMINVLGELTLLFNKYIKKMQGLNTNTKTKPFNNYKFSEIENLIIQPIDLPNVNKKEIEDDYLKMNNIYNFINRTLQKNEFNLFIDKNDIIIDKLIEILQEEDKRIIIKKHHNNMQREIEMVQSYNFINNDEVPKHPITLKNKIGSFIRKIFPKKKTIK